MNSIGQKIRKLRELRGYSQEYVASKLDMSQNNYSRIELDQVKVNLDRLKDISLVLEIDPIDILNFDERYIFNSVSNNQNGGEVTNNSGIFKEKNISQHLKDEIDYLREENRRLLKLLEQQKK
ncbi:MAG: helix-turn-helix transcriptional regulator [Bacteroidetes bacterium]|nr:helix-turn-helix transcriptional regulator [Bacteroidota bacterium]MBS1541451.1 helix-turn-helix transcriptional regulator [Bacteroidota bacterium]